MTKKVIFFGITNKVSKVNKKWTGFFFDIIF